MCMGGGGSPATITMPDTGAYDRMAQRQFDAMKAVQDSASSIKQQELSTALKGQSDTLTQLKNFQVQQAADVSANASRLAALIGAPPPEKTVQAPTVASDRGIATTKGKGALRINRPVATSAGQGAGLNIT